MTTLFQLATLQAQWLAMRQTAIAENVAHASTPGYRARDVVAFDDMVRRLSAMAGGETNAVAIQTDARSWAVRPSGNSVSLEEEMVRAGAVMRAYQLNSGLQGAFHRMTLAATRGA